MYDLKIKKNIGYKRSFCAMYAYIHQLNLQIRLWNPSFFFSVDCIQAVGISRKEGFFSYPLIKSH